MPPVRSRWKTQYDHIDNASKFHKQVGDILASDGILKNFRAFQEVPVKDLIPGYRANHFFDWYVEELNLIIELHGRQHYKATSFGGNQSYEDIQRNFKHAKGRDRQKKSAALAAGYAFLEISYKQKRKLNAELLKKLMFEAASED